MKRNTTPIAAATTAIVLGAFLGLAAPATAAEATSLDSAVEKRLTSELRDLADNNGTDSSISNVSVDVSRQLIAAVGSDSPAAIADFIVADVSRRSQDAAAPTSNPALAPSSLAQQRVQLAATRTTASYTADQSTAIPAFGIAWVNQDMSVTFSGSKISSVKLQGTSYGTGIAVFSYSHIKTTTSYSKSQTCLLTRMKGTFSAFVKGSAVSFAAAVLAADGPRGGRMVSLNTNDC